MLDGTFAQALVAHGLIVVRRAYDPCRTERTAYERDRKVLSSTFRLALV